MATVQFNLRIPEELKQKIDDASKESGRSINAEAAYRLEQSFNGTSNETGILAVFIANLSQELQAHGIEFKDFQKILINTINNIEANKKPTA